MEISRPLPDQHETIRWVTEFVQEQGFGAVVQTIDAGDYSVYRRVWVLERHDDLSDHRRGIRRFLGSFWGPDPGYAERALLLVHPYPDTRMVESRAPEYDALAMHVGAAMEYFCGETVFVELKTPYKAARP